MPLDPEALPRQLRYWTGHCLLNALPSFVIAGVYVGIWKSAAGTAAMISAVATFIVLFTLITSLRGPLADRDHILSRALRIGTKIRMFISLISLILLIPYLLFFMPDFWCGWAATLIVSLLKQKLTGAAPIAMDRAFQDAGFLEVFATTLLEGFILSFLLLMISFFAMLVIQKRDRRRMFPRENERSP